MPKQSIKCKVQVCIKQHSTRFQPWIPNKTTPVTVLIVYPRYFVIVPYTLIRRIAGKYPENKERNNSEYDNAYPVPASHIV
jgi:hypothetical protein